MAGGQAHICLVGANPAIARRNILFAYIYLGRNVVPDSVSICLTTRRSASPGHGWIVCFQAGFEFQVPYSGKVACAFGQGLEEFDGP